MTRIAVTRLVSVIIVVSIMRLCAQPGTVEGSAPERKTVRPSDAMAIVLDDTGRSGSLVYGWTCARAGDFSDPLKVRTPPATGSAVERLSVVFDDPSFRVREDANGLVRVTGGSVGSGLLDLRIHRIVFRKEADPGMALVTILNSAEISTYVKERQINMMNSGMAGIYPHPTRTSPRLDGSKENITVSEALDLLALTYSGMWSYKECSGESRIVEIHFYQWSLLEIGKSAGAPSFGAPGLRDKGGWPG